MNVCVIGSGGREHSICFKIKQSKKLNNLFCMPGNAGTSEICKNLNVDISNFNQIYSSIKKNSIDLAIIGPEIPLVNGIVDFLEKKKIKVFGPNKKAAQLEGSKIFMKNLCNKFNIPSAQHFSISSVEHAKTVLKKMETPIVVKSDGLAAGKGVTICNSKEAALIDIISILNGKFTSSNQVIIEEFLEGEEASYFVLTDGRNFKQIGTAQDHKRIGENDTGLNTGGMGAYSPSLLINKNIEKKIIEKIIIPTITGMEKIGCPYKGILYAGLMINKGEPKLIEYNIRFGDPECQVLMLRMKSDIVELMLECIDGEIKRNTLNWENDYCATVVMASDGYPGQFEKRTEIKGLDKISKDDSLQVFHASTIKEEGKVLANGGRVLSVTGKASSLSEALNKTYFEINKIEWPKGYYRRDIGQKGLR